MLDEPVLFFTLVRPPSAGQRHRAVLCAESSTPLQDIASYGLAASEELRASTAQYLPSSFKTVFMPHAEQLSSEEQAIADLLMHGILHGGLDVSGWHEDYWPSQDQFIRIESLEGVQVSLLSEVMRKTGLPLLEIWRWAAWDPEDGLVRTSGWCSGAWNWPRMKSAAKLWKDSEPPEGNSIVNLVQRSRITIDHSHAPMLVRPEALSHALSGEVFQYDLPGSVSADELSGMALVYFTRAGKTSAVSAEEAAKFTHKWAPLCTRNSLYVPGDSPGGLRPLPNNARFSADAFTIALLSNPNNFNYYRLRTEGTIFQPAIERLAGPTESFVAGFARSAQEVAGDIKDWCSTHGIVWLTVSAVHPLEAELVTTPAHYEFAVKQIEERTQKKLRYSIPGDVSLVERPNASSI